MTGERSGKVFSLWTKAAPVQQQHKQLKSLRTFVLAWCTSQPKNLLLGKQLNLSQGGKKGEKNLPLGKKLKVGPVANCPQPPAPAVSGLSLENFFHVYLISHWVCSTGWSSVPNWRCFSLASNMGTDGVFSGQNIHRVSQASSLAAHWI